MMVARINERVRRAELAGELRAFIHRLVVPPQLERFTLPAQVASLRVCVCVCVCVCVKCSLVILTKLTRTRAWSCYALACAARSSSSARGDPG
jgi:hypothetical protein